MFRSPWFQRHVSSSKPAPPTRQRGRDGPLGIHVTIGRSRAPQASASHPLFTQVSETWLLGRNGAWQDNVPSRQAPRPASQPPEEQSARRMRGRRLPDFRLGAAAETRLQPGLAPVVRPPTHPAGLRSRLAGSLRLTAGARADLEAPESFRGR